MINLYHGTSITKAKEIAIDRALKSPYSKILESLMDDKKMFEKLNGSYYEINQEAIRRAKTGFLSDAESRAMRYSITPNMNLALFYAQKNPPGLVLGFELDMDDFKDRLYESLKATQDNSELQIKHMEKLPEERFLNNIPDHVYFRKDLSLDKLTKIILPKEYSTYDVFVKQLFKEYSTVPIILHTE